MSKNIWMGALLVAVAALGVLVLVQHQQINQATTQPPAATMAETPMEQPTPAPARRPPRPVSAPEPAPSEPTPPLSLEPGPASNPAAQAGAPSGTISNFFSGVAGMMKNPQMKEMVRAQQKFALEQSYGPLSKYVSLSPEQMDALKTLLLDRQMATVDASLAMMGGSGGDRQQAMEQVKSVTEQYNQKIKDLLSPQDYQTFQDYEKTSPERTQVQMFKGMLPADAMVTDQQEYDLISAMYEARTSMLSSPLEDLKNTDPAKLTDNQIAEMLNRLETVSQQYLERATAILTPQQLQQFQDSLKQQTAMQTMGLKMARQMFGGNAPQQPPATTAQKPATQ